jgi:hypothetical protein
LQLGVAQRIYEAKKAGGYKGSDLYIAFVAEYIRLATESRIIAHEGRHAIDMLYFPVEFSRWTDEREFRAKLSAIVFGSDPKFVVYGHLSPGIGSNTPHGKSDERLMKTIVEWMGKHTAEIPGIDTTRPLLPQFDRLTADQIKTLFREADPMAGNASKPL